MTATEKTTRSRRTVIRILIGGVALLVLIVFREQIWSTVVTVLGVEAAQRFLDYLLVPLISGVIASVCAAFLFSWIQKEAWEADVAGLKALLQQMKGELDDIKSQVSGMSEPLSAVRDHTNQMHENHSLLMKGLPDAIGGSFTRSMFYYHPRASAEVARVLSEEMSRSYVKYYHRVMVKRARDVYKISSLEHVQHRGVRSLPVWRAVFDVEWDWENDSRVAQYPLEDFVILIAAPSYVVDNIPFSSEAKRKAAQKKYDEFTGTTHNYVKSIVTNPFKRHELITDLSVLDQVIGISSITIAKGQNDEQTFPFSALEEQDPATLPIGIYKALKLPGNLKESLRTLEVHEKMSVEYQGSIALSAVTDDDWFDGEISHSPSDIISESYELTVVHPRKLLIEGKAYQWANDILRSGCQKLHEPFRHQPRNDDHAIDLPAHMRPNPETESSARIMIKGEALTDLHNLALRWSASPLAVGEAVEVVSASK